MAIFGSLTDMVKQCPDYPGFEEAFVYLKKIMKDGSIEKQRLLALSEGSFEKVMLSDELFALEQVYASKARSECFFESHRQYIDMQLIVQGEEKIDVSRSNVSAIDVPYQAEIDLLKYHDTQSISSLLLRSGDMAVFFPEDAHMPCLQADGPRVVYKTVVKVPAVRI
jgi:biofilm protein TabA